MKQTINLGSAPNDDTGDSLRVAGDKINDNFTEVYDANTANAAAAAAAQADADTALTNAATAQSAANAAQASADTALTNAATALTAANEADDTADAAGSLASTANSAAGAAQTTANTAVTNAVTAQSAANAAQTTANTAVTNAATAQTAIDTMLNVANRVADRVTMARINPIRLANVCKGALAANIDSSTTALTVDAAAAASAPQTGMFAFRIGSEDFLCTAGAGTTSWTVATRPINSSVAAAHVTGDAIICGCLSISFSGTPSPSQGDVSSNRKIYPTPSASTGTTIGTWLIPEILWQPFPSAMWENQANTNTQVSSSSAIYSQLLNRVLMDAGALQSGLPQAHVNFDGQILDMTFNAANSTQIHVLMDEGEGWRLAHVGPLANFGSPAGRWVSLNFGSRLPPGKTRKLAIYGDGNPCGGQGYFGAFAISTKDALTAYSRSQEPTCAIFGDSYMQAYTTFGRGGMMAELAHKLGLHVQNWNVRGGTGYLANNSTTGADGYTRLQNELARWSPQVLMVMFGLNDLANDATTLTTITNFYAYARSHLPTSLFIVVGALRTKESQGTAYNILNARILTALQAVAGPWILVNPNGSTGSQNAWYASNGTSGQLVADSWLTGSGRVGATSGIGNRDIYINTDDTHPVAIGSDYMSERAYQGVVDGLSSLVGRSL